MLTTKAEIELRSKCFNKKENRIKEIHINKEGIRIVFTMQIGLFNDPLSHYIGAPCSTSEFTIVWVRNKTDRQIADDDIVDFEIYQHQCEEDYQSRLENDFQELEEEMYDGYEGSDDDEIDNWNGYDES